MLHMRIESLVFAVMHTGILEMYLACNDCGAHSLCACSFKTTSCTLYRLSTVFNDSSVDMQLFIIDDDTALDPAKHYRGLYLGEQKITQESPADSQWA